ncbi:MAG: type III-B CRISPR-associated protein Cas10/Cmr2 [wastewater metagenome]|nr:type III-B CRISPR-associated protein Cas10/Cmr2 [Candidatus Loosdrechtia aerotolerans]
MTNEIFSKKLAVFLHDPIDKPFILMQGESHEQRARELADKLGAVLEKEPASDHIASAMERTFLPKGASQNKDLQIKFLENPCIKHPLSGNDFEGVMRWKDLSKDTFKQIANKTFLEIATRSFKDDKERFLYLWRNLNPLLKKNSDEKTKILWSLAPADTRIPDHSILEHLKISSACYNATYANEMLLNNCSLFLFAIGPIQSFIAQARKTQDLYWSSFILSYLNWKAIEYISDRYGPDGIIFPDIHSQPFADWWLEKKGIYVEGSNSNKVRIPTIPNRFLSILPVNDKETLCKLGNEIGNNIKNELTNIATSVISNLNISKPYGFDKQIENFLQIYWTFIPWLRDKNNKQDWEDTIEGTRSYFTEDVLKRHNDLLTFVKNSGEYRPNIGNAYPLLFSFAEKVLGARKNMRIFEQLGEGDGETGRKCALCGERNILFYKKKDKDAKLFNSDVVIFVAGEKQISPKYLQNGEGLCGVCFTKRCAEKYFKGVFGDMGNNEFPSTAKIAQIKFLQKINPEELKKFKGLFGNSFDEQLLYEENLTEKYFKKYGLKLEIFNKAKELQKKILECAKANKVKQTRYYAAIMLDGDSMGKWLSGDLAPTFEKVYHPDVWKNLPDNFKEKLKDKQRPMTPALHAAISAALRDYSLKFIVNIVEEKYDGEVVYAGGDDVLAFVNLKDLFDIMIRLRAAFSGHIDKDMKTDFTKEVSGFVESDDEIVLTMGPLATASMGVCIAHYKMPLRVVVQTAREMEQKAKGIEGKNAFAIAVMKRSGETVETISKWFDKQQPVGEGIISVLQDIVEELIKGKQKQDEGFSDTFVCKLREEFNRLCGGAKAKIDDQIVKTEIKRLLLRSCQMKNRTDEDKKRKKQRVEKLASDLYQVFLEAENIKNFISFLETAVFLAREVSV